MLQIDLFCNHCGCRHVADKSIYRVKMRKLLLSAAVVLSLCHCAGTVMTLKICLREFSCFCLYLELVSQSQFSCVSDCGSSSSEIGTFASILDCCANSSAGGFVQSGVCSPCLPFRGNIYSYCISQWCYSGYDLLVSVLKKTNKLLALLTYKNLKTA